MEVLGYYTSEEHYRDEGLTWEVFSQGLDVTSGKLLMERGKMRKLINN